jgi:hypothetical protein
MSLSDAQLQQIADRLFLMRPPAQTKLPKPTNTGPSSFTSKFDPIATDPRFKDFGINGDEAWRIGSASKIAIMLAAVQLRLDVRRVKDTGLVSTPQEFDGLFQMAELWAKSKAPRSEMHQIAGAANAPRISTIFDLTKTPPDFTGPDPDTPDQADIFNRLPADKELSWETAQDFTFSERLWLAGCRSDNVAATSCISEIGVPYMKAVQRAYGLFDKRKGMHFLLAGGFSDHDFRRHPVPVDFALADSPKYRPLTNIERSTVKDALKNPQTNRFDDQSSWEPGSAAALTAYMIALMTDGLVDADGLGAGVTACTTIRNNLADGGPFAISSFIATGVSKIARVTKQINKIGILLERDGEPEPLGCEFVHLETEEKDAGKKQLKYAVVATGLKGKVKDLEDLGQAVHRALLTP